MRSVNGHGGDLVVRLSSSCQVTGEKRCSPREGLHEREGPPRAPGCAMSRSATARRSPVSRYNRRMICAALSSMRTRFAASTAARASLVALLLSADLHRPACRAR